MSHRRQVLESILKDCGWSKSDQIWRNETFCIPQKTIDRVTTHESESANSALTKILSFAKDDPIIKNTIGALNRELAKV